MDTTVHKLESTAQLVKSQRQLGSLEARKSVNASNPRGFKQVSNFKGKLISDKIVGRTELMRNYQPPVKNLSQNNPFVNLDLIRNHPGEVSKRLLTHQQRQGLVDQSFKEFI